MHWTGEAGGEAASSRRPDGRRQVALALTLVAALAIPAVTPLALPRFGPARSSADNPCYRFTEAERGFARKMNQERKDRRLGGMRLDPELGRVAMRHTKEMSLANTLAHTTTSQLTRRVTNWATLGENVGVGSTVGTLHTAFMNSPAHRENVLYDTFNNVGVGVKKADGRMWVTVIFEARENPGTRLAMPSC
jgi:uncharacterized protein YkwD